MKERAEQEEGYSLQNLIEEFEKRKVRIFFSNLYFWAGVLFSLKNRWFCYINNRFPSRTQKWTLAHELGHFLLHQDLSLFFTDGMFPCAEADAEWQANRFAAELLMPKGLVYKIAQKLPPDNFKRVFEVSKRFEAPISATAWWLKELDLITAKAYQYIASAYQEV